MNEEKFMDNELDKMGMSEAEFERQFIEATQCGEEEMTNAPKAKAARFDRQTKRLIIDLQSGITVMIPARLIQIFQNADDEEIADIKILLDGLYLSWNRLDEDLSVSLLLQGRFGTTEWMTKLDFENGAESKPRKKVA